MAHKLTPDELVFVKRMAFHVARGLSHVDAARAVLDDDARIFAAFCQQSHETHWSWGGEDRSAMTRKGPGDLIIDELSRRTYEAIRRAAGDHA